MSEEKENKDKKTKEKKTLSLNTTLDKVVDAGSVKQSFSHGRSKSVAVEVKKRRIIRPNEQDAQQPVSPQPEKIQSESVTLSQPVAPPPSDFQKSSGLTEAEWELRKKVLEGALKNREKEEQEYQRKLHQRKLEAEERAQLLDEQRQHEASFKKKQEDDLRQQKEEKIKKQGASEEDKKLSEEEMRKADTSAQAEGALKEDIHKHKKLEKIVPIEEDEDLSKKKKLTLKKGTSEIKRREVKLTLQDAMTIVVDGEDAIERQRSLASIRRKREKEKLKLQNQSELQKIVREVIIPETITVAELANRMSVRVVEVIKSLMGMGVMATPPQVLDADTAELIVSELGHQFKRVSEADVEEGLLGIIDSEKSLKPRAPVVTIMGHVDHGKTSLLDAIRQTDVVSREAGGITQHIGAYQVQLPNKGIITFLDTPGHAAFTSMRARGADVTDIVILVVAADDSVMEQTIEAIHHAKAASKPIIVAINKIDAPSADPAKVKMQLLNHDLVVEDMGGEVQCIEVSAKKKENIDKLEEAILLQAEILELTANPDRQAIGAVIESKLEKGRGPVATVLVQRGTLKAGDIFVAGAQWGKVRTLIDGHGRQVKKVGPSVPVEVVGFNGAPEAGDHFIVVNSEAQAREIAEYRERKHKNMLMASSKKTMDQLFSSAKEGKQKQLAVVIKTDVQGSLEAIAGSFEKFNNSEVSVKVLYGGVGGISESDIILAAASNGVVIGFNVRANQQARDLAKRDGIEIRYYSIIYDIIDDIKAALSGMLTPELKEEYLGTAEVRQVFNITKVGKIAGCYVQDGTVQRGAKVRLLRDNVVIHEGTLKTLKRIKDEVKEVKSGMECGMAFENYHDLKDGDLIECFNIREIQRTL